MPQRPPGPRPEIVGSPSGPEPPFPMRLSGPVVEGFGRGSSELGIPTANIPIAGLTVGGHQDVESGIYYGWCGVNVDHDGSLKLGEAEDLKERGSIFEMVMSIGWNPFYKNEKRSVVWFVGNEVFPEMTEDRKCTSYMSSNTTFIEPE